MIKAHKNGSYISQEGCRGEGKIIFFKTVPKRFYFYCKKKVNLFTALLPTTPKFHIKNPHQSTLVKIQIFTHLQFADCYLKEPLRLLKKSSTFLRKRAELSPWLWQQHCMPSYSYTTWHFHPCINIQTQCKPRFYLY